MLIYHFRLSSERQKGGEKAGVWFGLREPVFSKEPRQGEKKKPRRL